MKVLSSQSIPDIKNKLNTVVSSLVPNTRTVNGKRLDTNISLTAFDVGALPTTGGTMTGGITLPRYTTAGPQANISKTLRFDSDQITTGTPVLMVAKSGPNSTGTSLGIGLGTTNSIVSPDWRCILRGIGTPIHEYDACPKDYVDGAISGLSSVYVPKSDFTLTTRDQTVVKNLPSTVATSLTTSASTTTQAKIALNRTILTSGASSLSTFNLPMASTSAAGCITALEKSKLDSIQTETTTLHDSADGGANFGSLKANTTFVLVKSKSVSLGRAVGLLKLKLSDSTAGKRRVLLQWTTDDTGLVVWEQYVYPLPKAAGGNDSYQGITVVLLNDGRSNNYYPFSAVGTLTAKIDDGYSGTGNISIEPYNSSLRWYKLQ